MFFPTESAANRRDGTKKHEKRRCWSRHRVAAAGCRRRRSPKVLPASSLSDSPQPLAPGTLPTANGPKPQTARPHHCHPTTAAPSAILSAVDRWLSADTDFFHSLNPVQQRSRPLRKVPNRLPPRRPTTCVASRIRTTPSRPPTVRRLAVVVVTNANIAPALAALGPSHSIASSRFGRHICFVGSSPPGQPPCRSPLRLRHSPSPPPG